MSILTHNQPGVTQMQLYLEKKNQTARLPFSKAGEPSDEKWLII